MDDLLKVFLLSMSPFGELRLSIPVGILIYKLDIVSVFFVSVIGNLIPALFIRLFFEKISPYLSQKSKVFLKFINWWQSNTIRKHSHKIEKYEFIGLALFIGIPLPLTGVYTGSLLAVLMKMPLKKAIPAVFVGTVISGLIVSSLIIFGINILDYSEWQILLGALLLLGLVCWYLKKRNKKRK